MKINKKKATSEDKFIRKYYCRHAREGYLRFIKRYNSKKFRRYLKSLDE